jgi:hypothetical protein
VFPHAIQQLLHRHQASSDNRQVRLHCSCISLQHTGTPSSDIGL